MSPQAWPPRNGTVVHVSSFWFCGRDRSRCRWVRVSHARRKNRLSGRIRRPRIDKRLDKLSIRTFEPSIMWELPPSLRSCHSCYRVSITETAIKKRGEAHGRGIPARYRCTTAGCFNRVRFAHARAVSQMSERAGRPTGRMEIPQTPPPLRYEFGKGLA